MPIERAEPRDGSVTEHLPVPRQAASPWSPTWRARLAGAVLALYAATAAPAALSVDALPPGALLATAVLAPVLIALTVIDIETYRLPDALTFPLALAGLGFVVLHGWDSLPARLIAAVAGYAALYLVALLYRHLRGRAGLGLGDAKLLAAAGAWLGVAALPMVVLIASLSALVCAGALALRGRAVTGTTVLPFGPFLALGFWIVWLYGLF